MTETFKKIIWVASYPKSGNTWVRAILCSLFFTDDGKFNFDLLKNIQVFEQYDLLKYIFNINPEDYQRLSDLKTLSKYWIETQKQIPLQKNQTLFLKTHHSCVNYLNNNFTSAETTLGLIYVIRDPRDIILSYANHSDAPIEEHITKIQNNTGYYYHPSEKELTGLLMPWDQHVESWLRLGVPKLIIRYEDLLDDTEAVIRQMVEYLKLNCRITVPDLEYKIKNIILSTNFNALKQKEKEGGFNENLRNTAFFNKGTKEQWKKQLNKGQIEQINNSFEYQMKRFNYI